jgi:hypothetical protein
MPGDPAEVRVVQLIFDLYANRDMSLRDICKEMAARHAHPGWQGRLDAELRGPHPARD